MKMTHLSVLAVACGALTVGACADQVTSPPSGSDAADVPTFAMSATDLPAAEDLGGRHIVVFSSKRGVPRGFENSVAELGGTVDAAYEEIGAAVVSGLDEAAASTLRGQRGISYAELEPVIEMRLPDVTAEPENLGATVESPGDPTGAYFFPIQWNYPAIMAPYAWAAGRLGSPEVTVAILDTGIDYLHMDLMGRVDLSRSVSFLPEDDELVDLLFPGREYITDLVWHGTHVASTVSSNALAAAGVTSQVTLMGVKVCSVYGGCPGSAIFGGIVWAVEHDADVINMSLGGHFQKRDYPGYVSVINRLFNYVKNNNVTMVVSAGNDFIDLDHDADGFKTYCDAPHVICVSATAPGSSDDYLYGPFYDLDTPTTYTNYGRSAISVAAPGGDDFGYVLQSCSSSSLFIPNCQQGNGYVVWASGTSMSSPHVAGLAALVVEDFGRNPARVKTTIQQSADDLGQPGTDEWYGKGRINVAATVGAH